MNCYEHQSANAVAICKACMKALCPDCAQENPGGISCKTTECAQIVADTHECMEFSMQTIRKRYSWSSPGLIIFPAFSVLLLLFAASRFYDGKYGSGLLMAFFAIGMFGLGRLLKANRPKSSDT